MISRIIKVEAGVISFSGRLRLRLRLRLITLTKALIFLDITKTKSYNCFVLH